MVDQLQQIGLSLGGAYQDKVVFLVGPNGSGKSFYLRGIAEEVRGGHRELALISNTPFDRFSNMRGIKRVSASRSSRSPKSVIKRAVADTIEQPSSRFYQIGATLEYCGYEPRFGFKVHKRKTFSSASMDEMKLRSPEFQDTLDILEIFDPSEVIWIDQRETPHSFSRAREFATVLRHEDQLRREGSLREIKVYLERKDRKVIELQHASSGELSLISSLVFLIATVDDKPFVLVDEPENSLHPHWQREYVDQVLEALRYREATLIIATHAPLIVIGALANSENKVAIFQVNQGDAAPIDLQGTQISLENIESLLWRAFDVITPASHFVSQRVLELVKQIESREIGREFALQKLSEMSRHSFDDQQRDFFGAIRELIDQISKDQRADPSKNG